MVDSRLGGCRPEPLSSYLKALGLIRVIAEQADPDLLAWWQADELRVRSSLDAEAVVSFLCDRYRPTPLLAPWNKGSGFGAEDATKSPKATAAVERIARSVDPRLSEYREAISIAHKLRERPGWFDLSKDQQVALCRSALPDSTIGWLDTTVVLTAESRAFPPLLGTGGNDGRFDFASNFMQRLAEVFGMVPRGASAGPVAELALAALTGARTALDRAAIGQFDPGAAGGPGSSPLGAAESLSNPWDFILLLEGALLFASGAARRLSTGSAAVAVPFMVRSTAAGHPSAAAAERVRGELWAPMWSRPAAYPEIARLMSEGRAEFAGHQAGSALDLARSLATLGVDRGVNEFTRHAFIERNGLATFAVPVGRLEVRERHGAGLLGQLDGWLQRVRTVPNAPGSLGRLLRAADDAQFTLARDGGPRALQDVLCAIGDIHRVGERSVAIRKHVGRPIQSLAAVDWLPAMDDCSSEHELAGALASLRWRGQSDGLLRKLATDVDWSGRPSRVHGLGMLPVTGVMAAFLSRLEVDQTQAQDSDGQLPWLGASMAAPARLVAIERFVSGEVDEGRLARLLSAYCLLDWRTHTGMASSSESPGRLAPPNPLFALVKPFFHSSRLPHPFQHLALMPEHGWPRLLAIGRADEVARRAIHRLRINRLEPRVATPEALAASTNGRTIAAACVIPATNGAMATLLRRSVATPVHPSTTPAEVLA